MGFSILPPKSVMRNNYFTPLRLKTGVTAPSERATDLETCQININSLGGFGAWEEGAFTVNDFQNTPRDEKTRLL